MGCCFRPRKIKTKIDASEGKIPKIHGGKGCGPSDGDRGPPQIEEEIISVKEVLSETPIPKPPDSSPPPPPPVLEEEDRKMGQNSVVEDGEECAVETRSEVFSQVSASQVSASQVSEINSASEGFETSAFREEEEVASRGECGAAAAWGGCDGVRRKPRVGREREVPGGTMRGKERRVGSPAERRAAAEPEKRNRGVVPSPEKRNRLVVPSPEKRNRVAAPSTAASRRRSASPAGYRKDLGGRTGGSRRSRSPATRADAVASRAGGGASRASGGLSRDVTEGIAAPVMEEPACVPAGKTGSGELAKQEEGVNFTETKESLENPNVSLECFIFL